MLLVPRELVRLVKELTRAGKHPVGRRVTVEGDKHLGPLGLVAWLEAPRPVEVLRVVAVVVEVGLEAGVVVLPDLVRIRLSGLPNRHVLREHLGALEEAVVIGGLIGGDHRLTHVHVRVLAAVVRQDALCTDLVRVQPVLRQPEPLLEDIEDLDQLLVVAQQTRLTGGSVGQQDERVAVALLGHVLRLVTPHGERPVFGVRPPVHALQEVEAMLRGLHVRRTVRHASTERVVGEHAARGHNLLELSIEERAIVVVVLVVPSVGIDGARDGVEV
mmetsp:Transcript_9842/g.23184  ORF Transcript_9842/g.23184 Transcript_9842/m.23184 type:complete len:273 (-) Transcript_9842:237-1055(-)